MSFLKSLTLVVTSTASAVYLLDAGLFAWNNARALRYRQAELGLALTAVGPQFNRCVTSI